MRLRPYRSSSDYKYVAEWLKEERIHALWCANLLPFPLSKEALDAFLEKDAEEWGGYACVAAGENGIPIGFFMYSVNEKENSGFLKFIVLNGELRGKGYGTQMIRLALKYAFEITGVDFVQLNVFKCNEAAMKCYAKAGLRVRAVEEAALCYREERWDRCNMVIEKQGDSELPS